MASTWTHAQNIRFQAAFSYAYKFESIAFDTPDFWDYIVKKVGDGKTVQECKDKFEEYAQEYKDGKWEGYPPVKDEKNEDVKNEKSENGKNEKSEDVKDEKSEDEK